MPTQPAAGIALGAKRGYDIRVCMYVAGTLRLLINQATTRSDAPHVINGPSLSSSYRSRTPLIAKLSTQNQTEDLKSKNLKHKTKNAEAIQNLT